MRASIGLLIVPKSATRGQAVLFNPLLMTILLAFWIVLIGVAIRSLIEGGERPGVHLPTARHVLDEHLTRGELGRDEYVQRRKALDYITEVL
jgi:uncharacterized membrane protein